MENCRETEKTGLPPGGAGPGRRGSQGVISPVRINHNHCPVMMSFVVPQLGLSVPLLDRLTNAKRKLSLQVLFGSYIWGSGKTKTE